MSETHFELPSDLEAAVYCLDRALSDEDRSSLLGCNTVDDVQGIWGHSLGRWIRNQWGLWAGSAAEPGSYKKYPLYWWFYDRGFWHPDDISSVIILAYWSDRTCRPFSLGFHKAAFDKHWEESRQHHVDQIVRQTMASVERKCAQAKDEISATCRNLTDPEPQHLFRTMVKDRLSPKLSATSHQVDMLNIEERAVRLATQLAHVKSKYLGEPRMSSERFSCNPKLD